MSALCTLGKSERLVGRTLIDRLFSGSHSHSLSAYPLRVVYAVLPHDGGTSHVRMMVSVPKRCFKHAVNRNRVKRQVRESYRLHKHILEDGCLGDGQLLLVAFIWLSSELCDTAAVSRRVTNLLSRLSERLRA